MSRLTDDRSTNIEQLLVSDISGEEGAVSCGSSVPLYKCKICSRGGELSYTHVFIVFHSFIQGDIFKSFNCLHFGLKAMVKPPFCPTCPIFFKSLNTPPGNAHLCMSISSSLSACTLGVKTAVLVFLILQKTAFLFQRGNAQGLETAETTSQPQPGSCTHSPNRKSDPSFRHCMLCLQVVVTFKAVYLCSYQIKM